jgi:micrococcal nuclease
MFGGHQKRPDLSALIALCCISLSAQAEIFSAKVIVVIDGDTVMVLREGGGKAAGHPPASPLRGGQKIKIRLANIDAPEKDQPFGKQSRDALLEMVGKKQVKIDSRAVDQYGRTVGIISVDGRNVNQEQVKRGMAWAYSHYRSEKTYLSLQHEAQLARRGLWAQTRPQAPWRWRKLHPSVKSPP